MRIICKSDGAARGGKFRAGKKLAGREQKTPRRVSFAEGRGILGFFVNSALEQSHAVAFLGAAHAAVGVLDDYALAERQEFKIAARR